MKMSLFFWGGDRAHFCGEFALGTPKKEGTAGTFTGKVPAVPLCYGAYVMDRGVLLPELYAAPVVYRVVADILETGVLGHSDDHRHVFYIEAADKEETFLMQTEGIGRDVLKEDVAVDVGKDDVIGVPLEEGSVAAACLDTGSYLVEACIVIGGDCRYSLFILSFTAPDLS